MNQKILIILVLGMLVVGGVVWKWQVDKNEVSSVVEEPIKTAPSGQEMLTQASCEEGGGTWSECGSACRETPGQACIQVCVEYCECTTDAECPGGFACGAFVEGVGVCQSL